MSDMMEIACDMKPLKIHCIKAGIRQISMMISSIFMRYIPKNVYICGFKFGAWVPTAKIDKYFHKYGI